MPIVYAIGPGGRRLVNTPGGSPTTPILRCLQAAALVALLATACAGQGPKDISRADATAPGSAIVAQLGVVQEPVHSTTPPQWMRADARAQRNDVGELTGFAQLDLTGMTHFVYGEERLVLAECSEGADDGTCKLLYFPLVQHPERQYPYRPDDAAPYDSVTWKAMPDSLPSVRFVFCAPGSFSLEIPVELAFDVDRSDRVWIESGKVAGHYLEESRVLREDAGISVLLKIKPLSAAKPLTLTAKPPSNAELPWLLRVIQTLGDTLIVPVQEIRVESRPDVIQVELPIASELSLPHWSDRPAWGGQSRFVARTPRQSVGDLSLILEGDVIAGASGTFAHWEWTFESCGEHQGCAIEPPRRKIWPAIIFEGDLPWVSSTDLPWEVCTIPENEACKPEEWQPIGTLEFPLSDRGPLVPRPVDGLDSLDPAEVQEIGLRVTDGFCGLRGRLEGARVVIDVRDMLMPQSVKLFNALDGGPLDSVFVEAPGLGSYDRETAELRLFYFQDGPRDHKHWPEMPITVGSPGFENFTFDPESTGVISLSPQLSEQEVELWLGSDSSGLPLDVPGVAIEFSEPSGGWGILDPPDSLAHRQTVCMWGSVSVQVALTDTAAHRFVFASVGQEAATGDSSRFAWPPAIGDSIQRLPIVLAGKPVTGRIEYSFAFDRGSAAPPPLRVRAIGGGARSPLALTFHDTTMVGGSVRLTGTDHTTMRLEVSMPPTPEFEAIEPETLSMTVGESGILVPTGGRAVTLNRLIPAVLVLVDASRELGPMWSSVSGALADMARDTSGVYDKTRIAVGQDLQYETLGLTTESASLLRAYRVGARSNPRPWQHLQTASREVTRMNPDSSLAQNRIILLLANDPLMYKPWSPTRPPFEEGLLDLYVIEVGDSESDSSFAEAFFDSSRARDYRFVRSGDELRRALTEFTARTE